GNEVLKQNASFFGDASTAANIAQVSSNDPVLDIAKGVIGSSNVNVVGFDNPLVAPIGVSWLAPGATAVSPGFSGTVTTAGLTNGAPDADVVGADAGDLVRFAIVVENTGAGVNGAFDVAIDDMFPDGFVIPGAGIRLLVTDGAGNALANTAGGAFVAVPGTGGRRNGTITLTDGVTGSLAAGRTGTTASATGTNIAVITYELEVAGDALPNNFYENTTVLSGFSATSGGANLSSSLPAASTTNQASVTTAPVDMVKTVLASDQPLTTGNRITVGEVISYQLVLTIPEGTTRQLQVVDDLDVGQAMLSVDSISATPVLASTTGFATALANARGTLSAPGSTMTIEFGDVTNGDRDNTTPETITVVYRAILLNVATNTIDLTKNNVATAYYIATPDGSTAMDSITVVEPVMVTDKSATPATADANDTITYVIDVRHTNVISDAVAFDVSTVDVIPAGLTYVPGSVHTSGGAAKAPTSLTTDGTTITATWALLKLAPFEFGRITYQATLNPETAVPLSITNTSTSTWTSVPGAGATTPYSTDDTERTGVDGVGGLNDFSSSDSATVTVSNPQIVKSLFATNDATTTGNNMTIGETGTYQLLVTLPEASIAGFQISDALPAGLRVIGTPSVLTAAAASGGQLPADFNGTLGTQTFSTTTVATRDTLVLDVGASSMVDDNVTTNNSFLVRFDGIVADVAGNVGFIPGATVLSNIAGVQITGGSLVTSNAITVNVVEPRLNLVKTFSPNNAAPGSTVSVTITVQNAGLSPGQESVLSDSLDARFDATTVAATSTPTGWTFARAGTTLTWSANAGVAHAAGTTLTFDFTVQLLSTNLAGSPIPNTASAITSTRAGVVAGERDEPARAGSAILGVVTPDLNVTKTDGVNTAIPGATLSFVVVTSNTGGAIARNVTLTDLPAAGTTYVGLTGPCTLNGSSTATIKVFDLGSIANSASVSCTLTVTVDNPAPAGTTGYVNSVAVADDGTNGADPTPANNSSTDSDTIVANPDLGVTKDDGVSERTPGAAVAYVVTVTNTGNIGATNILVSDTVPAGFVFGSCTQDVGYFSTSCTSSGGVVSTSVAVIAGGNGTARITIIGNIVNPAPAGLNTVTNTVRVIDDGANGMDPTSANNIATDADAIVAAPDLVISKSSVTSTVEPGGSVGYTITATNVGTQDATDVVVSDSLPAGLSAVCGSETPAAATCTNSGFTWTAGAFPVGRFTTYNYTLHAADPMPAGTHTLTNTATVADDGDNGLDPTPANNAATVAVSLVGTHVDLAVTKTDNVTQAAPGATLTYAITVVDNGNIGASGVQVTDTVPLGTTFASAPDTGHGAGVNTGDVVVWDIATVPAGVPVTLTLVVVVDRLAEPGMEQLVTTVAVEEDAFSGTDPTPGDN
ncbi:MAG: hypothetical protein ABIZ69_14275, partial [Ilumatobacteraceae bacterium]